MGMRRRERRPIAVHARGIVPEPVLAGLERLHQRMTGTVCVPAGVRRGGGGATADVTTLRATPKVQPPSTGGEAFDATGAARRDASVKLEIHRHTNISL